MYNSTTCYLTSAMVAVGEMSMSEIEVPCRVCGVCRNCLPETLHCLVALADAEQQPPRGTVSARSAAGIAVCHRHFHSPLKIRHRPLSVSQSLRIFALL